MNKIQELLYLIYDHNTKSLSIPQPVITDIDGDGIEEEDRRRASQRR